MGSLTAEQLADKLGTIKKKLSGAELIADDKVVKNFVDLNVPVNSEVVKYFWNLCKYFSVCLDKDI